jgi:hypothetical protein
MPGGADVEARMATESGSGAGAVIGNGAGGSVALLDAAVVDAEVLGLEPMGAAVRVTGTRELLPKMSSSLEWVSKVCSSRSSSNPKSDTDDLFLPWCLS